MTPFLQLEADLAINPEHISAVRRDGDTCVVYTSGGNVLKTETATFDVVLDHIHTPINDIREAAGALLVKLDQAVGPMHKMATIAEAAGEPYTGPNFADEIADLRMAMTQI